MPLHIIIILLVYW